MKNLWIVLVFSLLLQGLHAQNYQTVNSGRIAYFSFNDFCALKIDSTKVLNGDSFLSKPKFQKGLTILVFRPKAPSWSGAQIIVQSRWNQHLLQSKQRFHCNQDASWAERILDCFSTGRFHYHTRRSGRMLVRYDSGNGRFG